ncbi:hypothetical protein PROFUN_01768 [Planoprotostelium fungivorum]|uniref:Uncharacterized protein n=1 Tax=Planoprotostelium fungivorum TaxID=1890364 RepID=A0A2P6MWG0_9EUKA|nr:hypothetical protein PROFUN_01768 [Planoprotostelium fungivorum]
MAKILVFLVLFTSINEDQEVQQEGVYKRQFDNVRVAVDVFVTAVACLSERGCHDDDANNRCGDTGMSCRNGTCVYCERDADCYPSYGTESICSHESLMRQSLPAGVTQCIHKRLWRPSLRDYIGGVLLFFSSAIAGSSGLGGGGLFVPILYLLCQFDAHEAVPLSKAMIFGGALANLLMNIPKRFPGRPNITQIDYNVAAFMVPTVLAGTSLGVALNVMFPSWIILILLAVTLLITTWRMITKGVQKMREELKSGERQPLLNNASASEVNEVNPFESYEQKPLYRLIPFLLVLALLLIEAYVVAMTLLRGSKSRPSIIGVKVCSPEYYGIFSALFAGCFIFLIILGTITLKKSRRREISLDSAGRTSQLTVRWNKKNMAGVTFGGFIGGILAGLVGIGGGMVSSPILLEIGVHPQIVVATSTFLIIFTSSTTTIQYLLFQKLPWDYSIAYGVMTFFANILGNLFIDYLVKKYKKTFIIIFIVAAVVGASAVMLTVSGGITVYRSLRSGEVPLFGSLCDV